MSDLAQKMKVIVDKLSSAYSNLYTKSKTKEHFGENVITTYVTESSDTKKDCCINPQ